MKTSAERQRFQRLRTVAAIVALACNLPAGAQQPSPLPQQRNDLMAIYRDALAADATFAAARFARQAAEERTPIARSAQLPQVGVGVNTSVNSFDSRTPDFNSNYGTWGPVLSFSMPIYNPQLNTAVDQAMLSVQAAQAQFEQARQDLLLRVPQAYFDVLAAQDTLEAIAASKKAVSEQLAQAKREFEVGTKTIVDTHEAQARYDLISSQEEVARGQLIVRRNALRLIIGRDPGELVPLRERPELKLPLPASIEAWARQAEESNYQVVFARYSAEIATREIQRAREGGSPRVDLVASLRGDRSTGAVSTNTSNTTRNGSIGVQLNWPVYTGGLIDARVREATANSERSREELELARRNAAQAARQAYTGTDFGLAQVRALESAEVSAQSQLESTRLGYRVGVRINLDVLNATTQLFTTQRDLKAARYDFLVNGLRLESAAGTLDENDLQQINALLAR